MAEEDRVVELGRQVEQLASRLVEVEGLTRNRENLTFGQYSPFITRGAGRIVVQIPFDDVVDSGSPLECFFQMPPRVRAIRSASVWVQQKSYRIPSSTASTVTGGSIVSGGPSATTTADQVAVVSSQQHTHPESGGGTTGNDTAPGFVISIDTDAVGVATDAHLHTSEIGSHTHALNTTISEVAASGTISLFVADDGTNYGSAIISGASDITNQAIKSQLTKTVGDKRLKITSTGKARVQVLLLLDIRVSVL